MVKITGKGDDGKDYVVEVTELAPAPEPTVTTTTLVIRPSSPVVVGTTMTIDVEVAPVTASGSVVLNITGALEGIRKTLVNGKASFLFVPSAAGSVSFWAQFESAVPAAYHSSTSLNYTHTVVAAPPAPVVPTHVTINGVTKKLTGINVARTDGALVLYRAPMTNTNTSRWGTEVAVDAANQVTGIFDRGATGSSVSTSVPLGGYVLSGHNSTVAGGPQMASWLNGVQLGMNVTLSEQAPVPPPTPTGKLYLFGASGEGTDNGKLNAWLTNHAMRMVGVWSDREGTEIGDLGPGQAYANWRGPVDIALGGLREGQTWVEAAKGTYDNEWRERVANLAEAWGSRPQELLWARIAHEFNGSFSDYFAEQDEAVHFVEAFRRWSRILTDALPKAHPVWSPNDSGDVANIAAFWPGAEYAHAVAVDKYNAWPHRTTLAEMQATSTERESGNPYGIETWRQFAFERGVPMYFGEVGNPSNPTVEGGGGDAPDWFTYIEDFCVANAANADVMTNPKGSAGKVFAAIWFNISSGYAAGFRFFFEAGNAGDPAQPTFAGRLRQAKVVGALPTVQSAAATVSAASGTKEQPAGTEFSRVPVLGEYMMDGVGSTSQLSSRCNRLLIAFYQGRQLVEWGGDTPAKTSLDVTAWRNRSLVNEVYISIGGQGGLVEIDKIAAGIAEINDKQFEVDGIDFDNEAFSLTTEQVLTICRDTAKALGREPRELGVQFVPPGGPPVQVALDAAKAVKEAGFRVSFGQQLYETTITDQDVIDTVAKAAKVLGPENVLIGIMLNDSHNSWTAEQAVSRVKAALKIWPTLGGVYFWESARPGTRAAADAVGQVLGT